MQSKEEGSYVRSIVAMINDGDPAPATPPWVSPTKATTPPRTPPSYLSVARSNNGYNNALLYSHDHKKDRVDAPSVPYANGNGVKHAPKPTDTPAPKFVSLAQMVAPKKNQSKYSDLGLEIKSPERNCRSFLRNISSFEMISKSGPPAKSPESPTVTMVGQKMQHMLHLDSALAFNAQVLTNEAPVVGAPLDATVPQVTRAVPEKSVDVPDRVIPPRISSDPQVVDSKSSQSREEFANGVFKIAGLVDPDESFEPPPTDLAGQHFRKIATEEKVRLLAIAGLVDKQLAVDGGIPDEIQGVMRSASGKANLIVRERFRQFDDLCEENLCPKGQMTPGPADLAGFWDMVMIEVNSIFASFRDLAKAAQDNWVMPPKEVAARPSSASSTPRPSNKKSAVNKAGKPRRSAPGATDTSKRGARFRR